MGNRSGLFTRLAERRMQRVWTRRSVKAKTLKTGELRNMRRRARQLKTALDGFLRTADNRLTVPIIGSNAMEHPKGTDWTWRPDMWRWQQDTLGLAAVENGTKLSDGLTLFHDCHRSELTYRQIRNMGGDNLSPFGFRLDVFQFDGSFLSVVQDLPDHARDGLKGNHLVRMNAVVELEKPLEIFARLNIKHGPNTEQLVRELPLHEEDVWVEFDLAYVDLNDKRIEKIWVDLIFEGPQNNQITLRDISFSRSPRADL